jgi:hypothetical protein
MHQAGNCPKVPYGAAVLFEAKRSAVAPAARLVPEDKDHKILMIFSLPSIADGSRALE